VVFFKTKKESNFIWIIIVLMTTVIVCCTNQITKHTNNELPSLKYNNYVKTFHEYVILEYFSQYDFTHFVNTFRVNKHFYVDRDEVDYDKHRLCFTDFPR